MLHKVTSPNCTYNVFFRVSTKFKTYFNSSSDLLCCNALPKALAPVEVTLQVESLQWETFTEYEHTSHDLHDTKFSVSVAMTLKLPFGNNCTSNSQSNRTGDSDFCTNHNTSNFTCPIFFSYCPYICQHEQSNAGMAAALCERCDEKLTSVWSTCQISKAKKIVNVCAVSLSRPLDKLS